MQAASEERGPAQFESRLLNELSPKSREKYLQLEKEVAEKQDQLMEQMFEYREKAGSNSPDQRKPVLSEDSLKSRRFALSRRFSLSATPSRPLLRASWRASFSCPRTSTTLNSKRVAGAV